MRQIKYSQWRCLFLINLLFILALGLLIIRIVITCNIFVATSILFSIRCLYLISNLLSCLFLIRNLLIILALGLS
jgi:hypothetical protein